MTVFRFTLVSPVLALWLMLGTLSAHGATGLQDTTPREAGEHTVAEYARTNSLAPHNKYAAEAVAAAGLRAPIAVIAGLDAIVRGSDVILRWATLDENDSFAFEVEYRSVHLGMDFIPIGGLPAAGQSDAPHLYRFGVSNVFDGRHQLRLRILSTDGRVDYTEPVDVEVGGRPPFALGNPAHDEKTGFVHVPYSIASNEIVRLILVDADGRLVETLAFGTHEAGTYVGRFHFRQLESGPYEIQLHTESGSTSRPVCVTEGVCEAR